MNHRELWFSSPFLVLAVLLAAVFAAPLRAQPALAGPEITITTSEDPAGVALLAHPDGSFTAVWEVALALRARRFDARSRPLTGEIPLGVSSGFDAAAVGSGFVVVGLDDRDLYPRTLGRIFNADGTPRGAPFVVDLAASPALSAPRVAAAPDGGFIVVWIGRDARLGRRIVFLRLFSAAGVPQGKVLRMADPGFSGDLTDADVVRSPDGRLLALWSAFGYAAGQLLGPAGERFGGPFPLDAAGLSPVAAFAPDGGFLLAWRGEGTFGRLYDRTGRPRSAPFPIETDGNGSVSLSAPVLAGDGQGRIFAAWSSHPFGLRVVEIAPDGSPGPILARPNHLNTGTPLAAVAWGDGELAVAWGQHERVTWSSIGLGVQRFATRSSPGVLRIEPGSKAGLEGSGPFTVRVERREGNQGIVSVRYSLRSNLARAGEDFLPVSGMIAFADGETNPKNIEIPVLDDALPEGEEPLLLTLSDPAGGAVLGVPARARIDVRDDDAPCPLLVAAEAPFTVDPGGVDPFAQVKAPAVASLAGGGFVAAWEVVADRWQILPGQGSVLYDAAGQRIADSLWPFDGAGRIRLAAHPDGGFSMTAEAYELSSSFDRPLGAFGQRFDSAGRPLAPPYPLRVSPVALAAGKAGSLLALESSPGTGGGFTVSLLRYGKRGQPLGSPLIVTRDGGASVLASDAVGRGIVAWAAGPKGSRRLFVRRVGSDGKWLGRAIAADPLLDRQPGRMAVAASPDGRFVVVWEGFHDGDGTGIFGRRFAASGEPLGPVFLVNSRTAGDQTLPQAAVQGDGRFLVVWRGPHDQGRQKLYGQYFAAAGSRLGGEMLMTGDDPLSEELDAALASDAAGHYVLLWRRLWWAEEISCRRLTVAGDP